jgi:UDP-glucose 4-epimerase
MAAGQEDGLRCLVTGCAGFIGSNLVDRLLGEGYDVVGFDNFSTGREAFLKHALSNTRFRLIRGDALDADHLGSAMRGAELVFHLAANADVRGGIDHPQKDLEQNTIVTFNVLEAMRANDVRRIAFASSGSIYGEPDIFPTPEDAPFPTQTSLYGASKLAGEGLIQAYCAGFGFQAYLFRLVSILGERYTHGHVVDFLASLRRNPHELRVLGDGKQRKSYLYVQDCLDAMLIAVEKAGAKVNIFNLGTDEWCRVDDSLDWICQHLGVSPRRIYSGGARGWVGDAPFIYLDCSRIRALGWRPRLSIRDSVIRTVAYLQDHPRVIEARA